MKNFITAKELKKEKDYVLIDTRNDMQDSKWGYKAYDQGHIEGAWYLNLDDDLALMPNKNGGKHPLPNKNEFQEKLRTIGVLNNSKVFIYDLGDNSAAGRLWFLLKYYGIEDVKVVVGGYDELLKEGFKVTDEVPTSKKTDLILKENKDLIATYEEVKEYSKSPKIGQVLVDSRAYERYLGDVEPLYEKKGHIPNAVNYDYTKNFEDKKIKPISELKERFKDLEGFKDIIVSCGSGVTANSNIMALDEIGIKTRLYVGSYSEWVMNDNEVNKGNEDNLTKIKNK